MGNHDIKDKSGKPLRTSTGERLFWSDRDGDLNPKRNQTVYRESQSMFGGSTKIKSTYVPSKAKFKELREDGITLKASACFFS
jgi:hypothetical protein